jgi:hypothetical protein
MNLRIGQKTFRTNFYFELHIFIVMYVQKEQKSHPSIMWNDLVFFSYYKSSSSPNLPTLIWPN